MSTAHYSISNPLVVRTPRWVLARGRRTLDDRPVLLKTLTGGQAAGQRAELERELKSLQALAAASVTRAIEVADLENGPCLVLEDQGFMPLTARLLSERPSPEAFLGLAIELATFVGDVHRQDLILGALNPTAILVADGYARAQVVDVALVQRAPIDVHAMAVTLVAAGCAPCMAPEQSGRLNRSVDHRADLYALGATFYYILTGRYPFTAEDPLELLHAHVARTPLAPAAMTWLPEQVSRIAMRLLAKGAEDRYQSASGLRHDLERCRREWLEIGAISLFELGERDLSDQLLIPQRLFGRDTALATLTRVCDDAMAGRPALALVGGAAGVGKTSFVNELCRPVVQQRGYFIAGKFDQVARNVPYGALIQAFQSLVQQVLAEREERLAGWRRDLLAALGDNGGVVAAVIPEIEYVIGKQPPPAPIDVTEAQNRFRYVFEAFVGALAQPDHPLILFLDDLQWADAATIEFLHRILSSGEQRPLLVIGAYRDDELTPDHPLAAAIAALDPARAHVHHLTLAPLDLPSLSSFLAETLKVNPADIDELASLIWLKTDGNPFFVIQFLQTLRNDGLLAVDDTRGRWTFRVEDVAAAATTDNVTAFMAQRLGRVSPAAQTLLRLAASIGNTFGWQTYLTASGQSDDDAASGLSEALKAGLIQPARSFEFAAPHAVAGRAYSFVHDRVQQAAYALIDEAERPGVHLGIGRQLLAECGSEVPEERLFEIVNHLNIGRSHIEAPGERLALSHLNLAAARKAKASAAYQAALDYLSAAATLDDGPAPRREHDLRFAIEFEQVECLYLAGRFDEAESRFEPLLAHAASKLECAGVHELRVTFYENRSRYDDAIAAGRDGLALVGLVLPQGAAAVAAALGDELQRIDVLLAGRPIAALGDLPLMADVEMRAAMRLLTLMWAPIYIAGDQPLTSVISATMVRLSLQHGNTEDSAYAYVTHAMTIGPIRRDFQSAYEWGELALALNERFGDARRRAKIHQQIHAHVKLWRQPFEACIPHAREAVRSGVAAGDLAYAGYGAATESWAALPSHRDLATFVRDQTPALAFLAKVNMPGFRDALCVLINWALALQGQTRDRLSLSSHLLEEETFIARYHQTAPLFMTIFRWAKLQLCVVFEEVALGLEAAERAREGQIPGTIWPVLEEFWSALALAAAYTSADDEDRHALDSRIEAAEASLGQLAGHCPENFRCFWLLVSAERHRVHGSFAGAVALYDQAAAYAQTSGNVQQLALANDLCARAMVARGEESAATVFLERAYDAYRTWGAEAKCRQLEERYGHLLPGNRVAARTSVDTSSASEANQSALDVASVLKVAQAVAGEIEVERLLRTLMTIALENAGAERGVFFEAQGDALEPLIEAVATSDGVAVAGPAAAWDTTPVMGQAVVRYVRRTRQDVVIGRASSDDRFAPKAPVTGGDAQSILCVPIANQGRLSGILYLEHSLTHAFTPTRTEIVRVLASQAAISLENARLYDGIKQEVVRRSEAEQALRSALTELEMLKNRLQAENRYLQDEIRVQHNFEEIVGGSGALAEVLGRIDRVAPTHTTVLILGETGTGKELIARAVHNRSPRRNHPLVKVNCGAIAAGLIESELFGHVKGAFTGALERRTGRFELADKGTIFLDEVGELPLDMQVKLLRVLQEQEFEPVGSSHTVKIDVRVIAATNRNLEAEVAAARFRADLFYRLNVLPIHVPPLRERSEDVAQLAMFFVQKHAKRVGRTVEGVSRESLERLARYPWPGNVRELENVIERALVLSQGGILDAALGLALAPDAAVALEATALSAGAVAERTTSVNRLGDVARAHIAATLEQTNWVIDGPRGAARILAMHPNTLRSRMKKLGLRRA